MIDSLKDIVNPIKCKCGREHRTEAKKIVFSDNTASRACEIVKEALPLGHILLTGEGGYYSDIKSNLRRGGFIIDELSKDCNGISDNVRLIVGVGGREECDRVKLLSAKNNIPNVFFITKPETDEWLNDTIYSYDPLMSKSKGVPPQVLVADTSIKPQRSEIARGYAALYLRLINIFDYEYNAEITGSGYCGVILNEMKRDILSFMTASFNPDDDEDIKRLTVCLMDVALKMSYMPPINGAAATLEKLLTGANKDSSYSSLIAAHTLNRFYAYFLNNIPRDFAMPPDRLKTIGLMHEDGLIDETDYLINCDVSGADLMKSAYMTKCIKEDLISELSQMLPEPSSICRRIKGIYKDKGYRISEYADYDKLIRLLEFTGELSEGFSLIKYIYLSGLLIAA
ncbi:MAG: hypothetical protein ACOX3U_07250 [Christensenellales bacterium]|jgi:hypothetical protein